MPHTAEQRTNLRQERRDNNLCIWCGEQSTETSNNKLCPRCREKKRLNENDYKKKLRIEGTCIGCCCEKVEKGTFKCRRCHNKVRDKHKKFRDEALAHYGRACKCCGETGDIFLCIDHVNNDGAAHRKEIGQGGAIFRWLKKNNYPDGFQILCWNCNMAKQILGQCPHQKSVLIR